MQHLNAFPQKAQLFKHGCDRESCLLRPNFKKGLTTWIPAKWQHIAGCNHCCA